MTIRKLLAIPSLVLLALAQTSLANAEPKAIPTNTPPLTGNLSFISSEYPALPVRKSLKKKPLEGKVYQYDDKPLGDRNPLLLVHGLRGEYYSAFRWGKVAEKLTQDDQFCNRYKVYLLRYDSLARLHNTIPQFRKAIADLNRSAQGRPVTIIALSMGGNLVYEGMLDKATDEAIQLVLALGTPFHGSPLFCEDWLQYSIYKNVAWPWTRVDHGLDYRFYFHYNSTLQKDLRWDNTDGAIPNIGPFKSKLPLGPHGDLTVADSQNKPLAEINDRNFEKRKLITYGGYLLSPYMHSNPRRTLETVAVSPARFFATKIPSHLGKEHAVLRMLNREIGSIRPSREAEKEAGTRYIYQLNDGIAPLSSALFLPTTSTPTFVTEAELPKLNKILDVRRARIFKDIDHLTYIEGYRPVGAPKKLHDELNREATPRSIFDWMLADLNDSGNSSNQLAREQHAPGTVPPATE